MLCPDCAGVLVEVSLSGLDKSFRCFTCGGIWLIAKTINGLPSENLASEWKKIEIETERLGTGDNKCPTDKSELELYAGDLIPSGFKVRQCQTCHWWWFPGDSLFKFKPYQEERVKETVKKKSLMPMMMAALVPLMSLVLLITGSVVGLKLISGEQKVTVGAAGKLRGAYGTVLSDGKLLITINYVGELKDQVSIFLTDESRWVPVEVIPFGPGAYQVTINANPDQEANLRLRVDGAETQVVIRQ